MRPSAFSSDSYIIDVPDEMMMELLGQKIAKQCGKSCIIYLNGVLGAGKTTFTRGFIQGLGYKGHIKSPSYALVESYLIGQQTILHFDFYRLFKAEELINIGIEDYFKEPVICLIEWPQQGKGYVPEADLHCYITNEPHHRRGRRVKMKAGSEIGREIIAKLR